MNTVVSVIVKFIKEHFWLILIIILLALIPLQYKQYKNAENRYEIEAANCKAYQAQLEQKTQVFQFTVEQLNYLNDSVVKELDSVRKELGIKDKQIKQLQKIKEYVYIQDTVTLHDTIFKDRDFVYDTCLGDRWYSNCLHLAYPDTIESQISMELNHDCFIYSRRETVNPPCKTWIGRLFQKKHTVIDVIINEHNPYVINKESKFIKILDQ